LHDVILCPHLPIIEPAAGAAMPPRFVSTDDLNAAIERVTPDVLALLADGVPRTEAAIVKALAGRHSKQDVKPALARLNVLGRIDLKGSRYTLLTAEAGQGLGESDGVIDQPGRWLETPDRAVVHQSGPSRPSRRVDPVAGTTRAARWRDPFPSSTHAPIDRGLAEGQGFEGSRTHLGMSV
jgi:hypothetical protein